MILNQKFSKNFLGIYLFRIKNFKKLFCKFSSDFLKNFIKRLFGGVI